MPFKLRRLERRRGNEPLDVAGISRWHFKHRRGVWYGHVLFGYRPSRAQIGFTICRYRGHGISPHVRRCADAGLGHLGGLVELPARPVQREWTSRILFRLSLDADPVRHYLQSFVKANQSVSTPKGKNRRKPQQWSRTTGVVG